VRWTNISRSAASVLRCATACGTSSISTAANECLRFHPRLRSRLDDQIEGQRGSSRGLLISLAAAAAIAALFFIATAHSRFAPQPRAQMSQPVRRVPQELVAVVDGGKTFHRPGCRYMHGKYRMVTPEEAIREGYSPCVYCMHEALQSAGNADPDLGGEETASNATAEK